MISYIRNSGKEIIDSRVCFNADSRIMVDLVYKKLGYKNHHEMISDMFSTSDRKRLRIEKAILAVKELV